MTSVMAAHRGLLVDAMGRMIQWETDKARRNQATPEKLRRWLSLFYAEHQHRCQAALVPAMRTHLAWLQSDADAVAVTEGFVRQHIETSTQQLLAVLDSDPEEFPAMLETTLRRWEADRADAFADRILKDEVDYVRQR
jgi:hypothetical protein